MNPPCDICLERKCLAPGGPGTCKCDSCDKKDMCPRRLKPTIRITTKCTQKCAHCCFECDPRKNDHMTPAMAGDVAKFVVANEISRLNVMGGEFFCNPDWEDVLNTLASTVGPVAMRLVSNGDWAGGSKLRRRVIDFLKSHDSIYLALSYDKWHTNKHVDKAKEACDKAEVPYVVATKERSESPPIPVGRHSLAMDSVFGMFSCYCHAPDRMYEFLIDEGGLISKCPFGIWTYDKVGNYLNGGFRSRFKQFHGAFRDMFVPSCHRCSMSWESVREEMVREAKE